MASAKIANALRGWWQRQDGAGQPLHVERRGTLVSEPGAAGQNVARRVERQLHFDFDLGDLVNQRECQRIVTLIDRLGLERQSEIPPVTVRLKRAAAEPAESAAGKQRKPGRRIEVKAQVPALITKRWPGQHIAL